MSQNLGDAHSKNVKDTLETAEKGSRRIRFTFHSTSFVDILYLLAMNRSGVVKLKKADAATLGAVNSCRSWGPDTNRTVEIELAGAFDRAQFTDRMARACQSIVAI